MITKTMSAVFTKAVGGPQGIVEAIVNTTNVLDRQGDIIVAGAWLGAIGTPERVRVSRDHDHSARGVIGKVLQLKELLPGDPRIPEDLGARGAGALYAKAQLNLSKPAGREAFDDLAGRYVTEWSVAFDVAPDGEEYVGKVRYIRKVSELYEFSAVFKGAAPGTRTLVAKADWLAAEARRKQAKRLKKLVTTRVEAELAMRAVERGVAARQAARRPITSNDSFPVMWNAFGCSGHHYTPPVVGKSEPLGQVLHFVRAESNLRWQPTARLGDPDFQDERPLYKQQATRGSTGHWPGCGCSDCRGGS